MNDCSLLKKKLDRFSRLLNVNNCGSLSVLCMKLGKSPRTFFLTTKTSIIAKGTTFEPIRLLLYDVYSALVSAYANMVKTGMIYGTLYWFCFEIRLVFTVAVNSNRL